MSVKKKCNKATCRTLIDYTERYCERHRGHADKQYNKDIRWNKDNKKYAEFYASKEWRKLRNSFILAYPLCARCLENGHVKQAEVVHHSKWEIREKWEARLDWDNLESLCHACHNKEHKSNK